TTETVTVDDVTTERTNTEELRKFEATPHFGTLLEMAAALRSEDTGKGDEFEPQKMITVRLPRSQHETLKTEAEEHETSINKLCISKLLLPIAKRFIPTEKGKVRGRKPGPQGSRKPRLSEAEKTP
ncbi:MAG: toxin-antitoxin system HicB family antitoxin, partial [Pirellulaceae bacterium]